MMRGVEGALRVGEEVAEMMPKIGAGLRDTTISAETSARLSQAVDGLRNPNRSRSVDPEPYVGVVTAVHMATPELPYERGVADMGYTETYAPFRRAATQFPPTRPDVRPYWSRGREIERPEHFAQVKELQQVQGTSSRRYGMDDDWDNPYSDFGFRRMGMSRFDDSAPRRSREEWDYFGVKVGERGAQHSDVLKLLAKGERIPGSSVDTMFDPEKIRSFAQRFVSSDSSGQQVRILDSHTAVFTSGWVYGDASKTYGLIRSTGEPLVPTQVHEIVRAKVQGILR